MTFVSNDPAYWPLINVYRVSSYVVVASVTAVAYDWVLTSGQEFELLWRRRWSLMTFLYFFVRFIGILYSVLNIASSITSLSLTDLYSAVIHGHPINALLRRSELVCRSSTMTDWNSCANIFSTQLWMSFVVNAMLSVIMITRLYAMYQRSRKMLIFLVVTFLSVTIACGVIAAVGSSYLTWEELVLAGNHQCFRQGEVRVMTTIAWVLATMWEVLALFLAVWITVKHLRELRRPSRGRRTISNWFTALIKTHVLYFAAYAAVSCFTLGYLSPTISKSYSVGSEIYIGILEITTLLQMFVLGPRLMLSVREYHAKLETNYDDGIAMTTIAFQEHVVHVSEA